jgi:hypothetical protein
MVKTEDERLDALTEPRRDAPHRLPAAPASLGGMSAADLDWVENWLTQKRGTEHAARPYGKGSLLLTTLIFEVRRERRHRDKARDPGLGAVYATNMTADQFEARAKALAGYEDHPGYGHALHGGTGKRTGVIVGLGLPLAIIAAVVAGLMWWHTGGVLPQ